MASRPGPSIGWGLLVMFVTPLAVVALLLTIVGLPVALILVGAWLLALAVSGVFVALAAGQWILGRTHWNEKSLLWAAVVGVPVTVLVFSLPAVGMLLSLVGTWWALGALMLSLRTTRA